VQRTLTIRQVNQATSLKVRVQPKILFIELGGLAIVIEAMIEVVSTMKYFVSVSSLATKHAVILRVK
jgi:hypothetical protein